MGHLSVSKPRWAFGRSLGDFKNLTWAEKKLVACARRGKVCVLGDRVPDAPTRANAIRPELIRFLALGGDDDAPVHEGGLALLGAYVGAARLGDASRALDVRSAKLAVSILILSSRFDAPLIFIDTEGQSVSLKGSIFPGITGDRLKLRGNLFLHKVISTGTVRLFGIRISGNLECHGGTFKNEKGVALSCEQAKIGGSVFFQEGFLAAGKTSLLGIHIVGNLSCINGVFDNEKGQSLSCDSAKIDGNVFLNEQFHAKGEVRLLGVRLAGILECRGGFFDNAGGRALSCDNAEIGGVVFRDGVSAKGVISFAMTKIGIFADDIERWPNDGLILDGFRYIHIAASSATDAKQRIAWLKKQQPKYLNSESFALQPWMQLAKVLREQGHFRDAAEVDIARETHLRDAGLIGDRSALGKWMRQWGRIGPDGRYAGLLNRLGDLIACLDDLIAFGLHYVYGCFSGYGHRPMRIIYVTVFFWLAFAFAYDLAATRGDFAPPSPAIAKALPEKICRDAASVNWTQCEALRAVYPRFSPLAYSLDLILPVVHLGQSNMWTPISDGEWFSFSGWTQRFVWFEEIFGWVAALTLGGIATGLVKRRDG